MLEHIKRKLSMSNFKSEWNTLGKQYAVEVNEMVAFGEKHGWDKWERDNPEN